MLKPRVREATQDQAIIAKFLKGLADPTRLAVLRLLARKGELNQSQVLEHIPMPQGRLSDHLACLRWCHYIEARREGKHVFYSIRDPRVLQILALAEGLAADHGAELEACERIEESDVSEIAQRFKSP